MEFMSEADLKKFTREVLPLAESIDNPEMLGHLRNIVALVMGWSGGADPTIDLDEYVGERLSVVKGKEDDGWAAEFKKTVEEAISK